MRHLYNPIRNRIDNYQDLNCNFMEVVPNGYLSKYIYSYWKLQCTCKLTMPIEIKLLPNGCVDLMFDKNAASYVYVYGYSQKAFKQKIEASPDIFAVRFLPAQINRFFKLPFEEIYINPIRFNRLMEYEFLELEEKLFSSVTFSERIMIIEDYLKKQLGKNEYNINDNLLNAVEMILKMKGNLKLEDISNETSKSSRYIRKLFDESLGISPKKFIRIVRFQNTYKMLLEANNYRHIDLAMENGYYDQAHFIKEFRGFIGETPGRIQR